MKFAFFDCFYVMPPLKKGVHYISFCIRLLQSIKVLQQPFIISLHQASNFLNVRFSPNWTIFSGKIGVKASELQYPITCRLQVPK